MAYKYLKQHTTTLDAKHKIRNTIFFILFLFPATEGEWIHVGNEFEQKWDFPNCLGAVDGKHMQITPPTGSRSFYWNYKVFNSFVLMSIANANCEFLYCDIGTNGHVLDGGVLENIKFYKKLLHEELNLPLPKKPDNSTSDLPCVLVGDEAFALRKTY
jgi:hypothetical protein